MKEGFTISISERFKLDKEAGLFIEKCKIIADKLVDIAHNSISLMFNDGPTCEFRWRGKTIARIYINGYLPHHKAKKGIVFFNRAVPGGILNEGAIRWGDILDKVISGLSALIEEEMISNMVMYRKIKDKEEARSFVTRLIF